MDTFSIIINLIITAVAYLAIPVILKQTVLKKHSLARKTLILITVANGVLIYAIFCVIRIVTESGGIANMSAALLWSVIAYFIMKGLKHYSLAESTTEVRPAVEYDIGDSISNDAENSTIVYEMEEVQQTENNQVHNVVDVNMSEEDFINCDHCEVIEAKDDVRLEKTSGSTESIKVNEKNASKGLKVAVIVLAVLFVTASAGFVWQNIQFTDLEDDYALLEAKCERLQQYEKNSSKELEEIQDLECVEKAEFMDEYIVIVYNDGSYYHKYGSTCEPDDDYSFRAFNEQAAINKGYKKCSKCCE